MDCICQVHVQVNAQMIFEIEGVISVFFNILQTRDRLTLLWLLL